MLKKLVVFTVFLEILQKNCQYSFLLTNANAKGNYKLKTYPINKMVAQTKCRILVQKHRIYTWRYCTRTFSRLAHAVFLHFCEYCHVYPEFQRTVSTIG